MGLHHVRKCVGLVLFLNTLQCLACIKYPAYNTNETSLEKRYYRVSPTGGGGIWWPNNRMPYCFADMNARAELSAYVIMAWDLWLAAGVDGSIVQFDSQGLCTGDPNVLRFEVNSNRECYTDPAGYNNVNGPTRISVDPNAMTGMGSNEATMAHEIGHAWGLQHEHQRPGAWSNAYWDGTAGADAFTFNCQNLFDYATATQGRTQQEIDNMCHSAGWAQHFGLNSAAQILPITAPPTSGPYQEGGPIDFSSIMMYPSTGYGGVVNGVQQTVYTPVNGPAVGYNTNPSQSDVVNLMQMYPPPAPAPAAPCLANQPCSSLRNLFLSCFGCGSKNP